MKKFGQVALGLTAVGVLALLIFQLNRDSNSVKPVTSSKIFVGGDIHTLTVTSSEMIVTGHESAALSTDGGGNWKPLKALDGADIMGWAISTNSVFAGGHVGLFKSQKSNYDFARVEFYEGLSDVHSIGASGTYVYLASPDIGLMASVDDGKTWNLQNSNIGQGFMGSMLVDPKNPMKILAADMELGSLSSVDGGKSWRRLGGPVGPMAMAWNPANNSEIVVIGMTGAGISLDGGSTWSDIPVPSGAAAISFSQDGKRMYAASLHAPFAGIFTSTDHGKNWSALKNAENSLDSDAAADQPMSEMDPEMPGMDHSASSAEHNEEANRPLAPVLGVFGLASTLVISSAWAMRRKDRVAREAKLALRKTRGGHK